MEQPPEPPLDSEEVEEEVSDEQSSTNIFPKPSDPEVRSLHSDYKDGTLILQPDFQRYYVWDIKKASRLIESALLDIPIPTIYTSEEPDGKQMVIDGQQRLLSFFQFIDGKFGDRDFKLAGLKAYKNLLEGKTFSEIGNIDKKLQDKIKKYPLHTIMFKKESDPGLKYEIFERLNSGSVQLNHQELRNCTFRGRYNDLLKKLASMPDFLRLLGLEKPHSRMRDVELVLRFASFFHNTYIIYEPPMKTFLTDDMKKYQNINEEEAQKLTEAFKKSISVIKSMFGDNAFKRFNAGSANDKNGKWGTTFNASLFDVTMFLFAVYDKNALYRNLDRIKEALIYLMSENHDFIRSIEISTSSVEAVKTRFDLFKKEIDDIIVVRTSEPRLFSRNLKQALFDVPRNRTCPLCSNEIVSIDDADIDHIDQYWKGGRTIPENARLTHRYCNISRSRDK